MLVVSAAYIKWFIFLCYAVILSFWMIIYKTQNHEKDKNPIPFLLISILLAYTYLRGAETETILVIGAMLLLINSFEKNIINEYYVFISLSFIGFITSIMCGLRLLSNDNILQDSNSITELSLKIILGMISLVCLQRIHKDNWFQYFSKLFIIVNCFLFYYISARTALISSAFILCICFQKSWIKNIAVSLLLISFISLFSNSSKVDSTYGRSFILKTSLSLLKEPKDYIFGLGGNSFGREYMKSQAESLTTSPLREQQLADNIRHPLNEFVFYLIEYGLILVILILSLIIISYDTESLFCKTTLAVIISFMFFSYPMRYPITWIMVAFILSKCKILNLNTIKYPKYIIWIKNISLVSLLVFLSIVSIFQTKGYMNWEKGFFYVQLGKLDSAQEYYNLASKHLNNSQFVYNRAFYENLRGNYEIALEILNKTNIYDYEVALLKSKIHTSGLDYESALGELTMAERMCPNRFTPLFEKYKIFEQIGDSLNLTITKNRILHKPIKIKSQKIDYIKEYVMNIKHNEL